MDPDKRKNLQDIVDIAKVDPDLALISVLVNDPEQTEAAAKFCRGEISYAEMRMKCG